MTTQDRSMQAVLSYTEDLARLSYAPGETLISEGPSSGLLYILIDGAVEVLRGDVRVAIVSEPGAVFGEISALLGRDHTATVRAIEPIVVHRIENAETFLQQRPGIVFHVARILANRLIDDAELSAWIAEYQPELVFGGHVHEAPFARGGSWASRLGKTWVFNPGRQTGEVPTHIAVDTELRKAAWFSFEGAGTLDFGVEGAEPEEMFAFPEWVPGA